MGSDLVRAGNLDRAGQPLQEGHLLARQFLAEHHDLGRTRVETAVGVQELDRDLPGLGRRKGDPLRAVEHLQHAFGGRLCGLVHINLVILEALVHKPGSAAKIDDLGNVDRLVPGERQIRRIARFGFQHAPGGVQVR